MNYWVKHTESNDLELQYTCEGLLHDFDQAAYIFSLGDGYHLYTNKKQHNDIVGTMNNLSNLEVCFLEYGEDMCKSIVAFLVEAIEKYPPSLTNCVYDRSGDFIALRIVDDNDYTCDTTISYDVLIAAYNKYNCKEMVLND